MADQRCGDGFDRVQRMAGVAFFLIVERGLKATGLKALPPPLVGMVVLFVLLLALDRIGGAQPVFKALEPGYRFLVKWAPLFFLPALVKLPLVEDRFSTGVLLRFVVLLCVGFLVQLVLTAGIASSFPMEQTPALAKAAAKMEEGRAKAYTREPYPRPGRPFKRRWLPAYFLGMVVALCTFGHAPMPSLTIFMVCATLLVLVSGNNAPPNVRKVAHPILVALFGSWLAAAVWSVRAGPEVSFHDVLVDYAAGAGNYLSMLLGPLVIALALLLYERQELLRRDFVPILTTTACAAVTGLFITAALARLLGLPEVLSKAAVTRFLTAPLALAISGMIGSAQTWAIAMVVITGLFGATLGGPLMGCLQLRSARARGLSIGASSHVLGTVSLATSDAAAFPYGAVCFVLVGTISVVLVALPPVRAVLLHILA